MIAIKTMPFFLSCVVSEGKTTWFESRAVNEDVTVCLITAWDVLINKMTFVKGMLTGGLVCVWFQMRFFFRQASSNLRDSFTMVFAQNSSIFHWAVHQPVAFFHVRSHTRRFEPLIEELWLPLRRHFFPCTHVHKLQGRCELSTLNKTLDWGRSRSWDSLCLYQDWGEESSVPPHCSPEVPGTGGWGRPMLLDTDDGGGSSRALSWMTVREMKLSPLTMTFFVQNWTFDKDIFALSCWAFWQGPIFMSKIPRNSMCRCFVVHVPSPLTFSLCNWPEESG